MTNHPEIAAAVEALGRGGLVAFPTETVYGLGADATNAAAVRRIFEAKGRPSTNPLIVHVASAEVARRYARIWPGQAEQLAHHFWPGSLTLVVPKSASIVAQVTAGRDTVGLRAPDHPLTLQLLAAFDGPVAGPSANRSNRVSPTTADHVRKELGGRVDLILDGGPCRVGIESTVLDLSREKPMILRPGGVSREQIEAIIGSVEVFSGAVSRDMAAASPGQQTVHYAPGAEAIRFEARQVAEVARWCREQAGTPAAILVLKDSSASSILECRAAAHRIVEMPADVDAYARHLYAILHAADEARVERIWIELPPDEPAWAAVRDRLLRATRPV